MNVYTAALISDLEAQSKWNIDIFVAIHVSRSTHDLQYSCFRDETVLDFGLQLRGEML